MAPIPWGIVASSGGAAFAATGGTIQESGGYRFHIFNSSSTFSVTSGQKPAGGIYIYSSNAGFNGGSGYYERWQSDQVWVWSGPGGSGGNAQLLTTSGTVSAGSSYAITVGASGGGQNSFSSLSTTLQSSASAGSAGNAGRALARWDAGAYTSPESGAGQSGNLLLTSTTPAISFYSGSGGGGGGALAREAYYGRQINMSGKSGGSVTTSAGGYLIGMTGGSGGNASYFGAGGGSTGSTSSGGGGGSTSAYWGGNGLMYGGGGYGGSGIVVIYYALA